MRSIVAILGGTAGAYALYILKGWETADPVGLLTTTIELAGALIVLSPVPTASAPGHDRWIVLVALPLALVSLLGTTAIASAAQTSSSAASPSTGLRGASVSRTSPPMTGMSSGAPSTALRLATTSPAGPIVWPDDMGSMATGMQMTTPNCVAQPTVQQQKAAVTLVDQTVATVAPYKNLAAAQAAGYIPVTPTGKKIVHYINPSVHRQGEILDPDAIPALVYVNTSHGAVLSAAMYLMPRSAGDATPPQPGGCLTQWHIHTDLCFSAGGVVGNDNGGSCAAGSVNKVTEPMMHVWLTPVPGGPLAPDPPAAAEVTAANDVPAITPPNASA